jgi:hypothetical protein
VVFGDTKEGSMAIRVPLWMTPPHTFTGVDDKKKVKHVQDPAKAHRQRFRASEE